MTNEEFLTALRCCMHTECSKCPLSNGDPMDIECVRELVRTAADLIEKLTERCARYAEEIAVLQEREKWVPVWRNDETAELVNYMIYSPDFGVDIGNYHAKAGKWLCVALPCTVTHWRPLPDGPEVE